MWKLRSVVCGLVLWSALVLVAGQGSTSKWQTLSGKPPLVIARGGLSGLFPDSSEYAYAVAAQISLPNVIMWCDVQLTKDEVGICLPDVKLDNSTDANFILKNKQSSYLVNGVNVTGWFSVDFTMKELAPVSLRQGIFSRTNVFDDSVMPILPVESVVQQIVPRAPYWLNIQHDAFFSQHNLSMRNYVISVSRSIVISYISSPEVNFLRSIVARFKPTTTKLVFRFLGAEVVEPSTNQTYGSLLKNLTFIKTFASGILVPKTYISPMTSGLYQLPSTSVVLDAHKAGLEVFAADFANDASFAYNFSYDPVAEYLSFIDNGVFSVDGVLTDFSVTPSGAIDCYSHMGKNDTAKVPLLVISSEGASGDYPGCSDLAYTKAISDGVDILDCPVQLTRNGIPFCLGSINLLERTNVAETELGTGLISIPDLNIDNGVFAFNLTWDQIKGLRPQITNPFAKDYTLYRNPNNKNAGNFTTLSDFLLLAQNTTSVSGVLIKVENAAYLAEKQGLGVINAVLDALNKTGYNDQTAKKVMIQSTNSSVLEEFKNTTYELVYYVDENIRDATNASISDIKSFASSVVVNKKSVLPINNAFLTGVTGVVPKLQNFNLSVYVQLFSNEYISQAWDFFSDPYFELNSFAQISGMNGAVTDFPSTANKYRRNRCLNFKEMPPYMIPAGPGDLLKILQPSAYPPAIPPSPVLAEDDVNEPPLPAVTQKSPSTTGGNAPGPAAAPPPPPNGQASVAASIFLSSLCLLLATVLVC
ncbi:phosphodiesterase [Lithospermum erythrorhizon]|uniref:glycerophosphodiester phosphodiesterase n=1 Tax=Lithospermum erythrorhizon TaxID=34254 RepID=A0AAV3NLA3_LITER